MRGIVAHLEIDKVNLAAAADGAVQRDDLLFSQIDPRTSFPDAASGEQQRDAGSGLPDSRSQVQHCAGIADAFEKIDAPLKQVGLERHQELHFRQHLQAAAPHQRGADSGELFATQGLASQHDRFAQLHVTFPFKTTTAQARCHGASTVRQTRAVPPAADQCVT